MAHIELLNEVSKDKSLLDLNCKRDPCIPEQGGGGYTLGAPELGEQGHEEIGEPIQICSWP